jgi:hypothetical protein
MYKVQWFWVLYQTENTRIPLSQNKFEKSRGKILLAHKTVLKFGGERYTVALWYSVMGVVPRGAETRTSED